MGQVYKMRRDFALPLLLALSLFTGTGQAQVQSFSPGDRLLVMVHTDCRAANTKTNPLNQMLAQHNNWVPELTLQAVSWQTPKAISAQDLQKWLKQNPCVERVSLDVQIDVFDSPLADSPLNDDPRFTDQRHFSVLDVEFGHDLFWRSSFAIKSDVTVAIVDSGVDYNHPDLIARMWSENGRVGYDFHNGDQDPMDDNGHGTHVAGLAAAESSNRVGVSGIMGFRTKIMALKTQGANGAGNLSSVVNAVRWAADRGAHVINMSLGARGTFPEFLSAAQYAVGKGAVLLAAAGNNGERIDSGNAYTPVSYAAQVNGFVGVGSLDALSLLRSSFSNYSTQFVDLAAPGSAGTQQILSTFPGASYRAFQGTSMACPVASGAMALMIGFLKSQGLSLTPAQLEEVFLRASQYEPGFDGTFAEGRRLNMKALAQGLLERYVMDGTGGFDEN